MKWTKATIKTTTKAEELVCNLLDELGIIGVEIENNVPLTQEDKESMFVDIDVDQTKDDGTSKVSFYMNIVDENHFDEDDTNDYGNEVANRDSYLMLIDKVKLGLADLSNFVDVGEGTITISDTEDKDWINNWKEFFKQFKVADDIVIKPTWEELNDEHKDCNIVVEIDPGIAFGTGIHETTKLCIQGLRKYINKDTKLLDVGCGSGILSIIGLKLGVRFAYGTDIDISAIKATKENMQVNGLSSDRYEVVKGNILDDSKLQEQVGLEEYDVVVANILADVIIPLSHEVGKHLKPNGLFITSGIIDEKKQEVHDAIVSNGFEILETNEMGDWVSFVAKKK